MGLKFHPWKSSFGGKVAFLNIVHPVHVEVTDLMVSHSIKAGVAQGSILRPTLILVYINELVLFEPKVGMYADDTTIYFTLDKRLSRLRWLVNSGLILIPLLIRATMAGIFQPKQN